MIIDNHVIMIYDLMIIWQAFFLHGSNASVLTDRKSDAAVRKSDGSPLSLWGEGQGEGELNC